MVDEGTLAVAEVAAVALRLRGPESVPGGEAVIFNVFLAAMGVVIAVTAADGEVLDRVTVAG